MIRHINNRLIKLMPWIMDYRMATSHHHLRLSCRRTASTHCVVPAASFNRSTARVHHHIINCRVPRTRRLHTNRIDRSQGFSWSSSHIIKDRNPKLITALNIPDNKSQGPFRSTHSVRNSPTSPIKLCKVVVSTLWQYTSQWWMDSAPLTHVAKRPVSVFNQLSRVKNLPERLSHPHQ